MISTQLPEDAHQLATQYELGEPIRIYRTNVQKRLKLRALIMTFICLPVIAILGFESINSFGKIVWQLFALLTLCILLAGCIIVLPVAFARRIKVYICTNGFIYIDKVTTVARWGEVMPIELGHPTTIVRLIDQRSIRLGQQIDQWNLLLIEIQARAWLAQIENPGKRADMEQRLAQKLKHYTDPKSGTFLSFLRHRTKG
jgi:hypothetical protein